MPVRAVLALVVLVVAVGLIACGGSDPTTADDTTASSNATRAPSTNTDTSKERATRNADAALERGDYAAAIAAIEALNDDTLTARYKAQAARSLRSKARQALNAGSLEDAARLARQAQSYDPTDQGRALVRSAERRIRAERAAAQRAAERKREARRAEAARRRAAKREAAARRKQRQQQQVESNVGKYAGMNCDEIGHSFEVPPGADPDHDADGDGVACESQ